jgi:hypothetical protein
LQKNVAKKLTLCPLCKALCLGQIQHNTSLSTTPHIFKQGGGCIMLWVCLSLARTWEFWGDKKEVKTVEENLVQSAFQQTLGEKPFSWTITQNNSKDILEYFTKMTLNATEWPSYSFDLTRLEDLWQENVSLAMINNQMKNLKKQNSRAEQQYCMSIQLDRSVPGSEPRGRGQGQSGVIPNV